MIRRFPQACHDDGRSIAPNTLQKTAADVRTPFKAEWTPIWDCDVASRVEVCGLILVACFRDVFADRPQEYDERALDRQCLKARIEVRAVAERALFLCSDSAGMISGQNIAIDGSW